MTDHASRIEFWDRTGEDLFAPIAGTGADGIRTTGWYDGDRRYEVLMSDGSVASTTRRECFECGNVIEPPTSSERTAYRERRRRACEHQRPVLDSEPVEGVCPECGELQLETADCTDSKGNVIHRSFLCAGCGAERSTQ